MLVAVISGVHMKTAVLIGYHGHKNLGDDIFRKILMKWMSQSIGIKKCFITAPINSIEGEMSGVKMYSIASPVKSVSRLLWIPIFFKSLKSDYLIFSAGSIFTIQPFLLMYITLRLLKFIRGDSLDIVALGVSIGPFNSDFDRDWCFKSLGLMKQVLLRDKKSTEIIQTSNSRINYKLSYDLALCWRKMFPAANNNRNSDGGIIGLALTSRGFGECSSTVHSTVCDAIVNAIEAACNIASISEIRIFAVCSDRRDGDIELSEHISARMKHLNRDVNVIVYNGSDIDGYLSSIYECSIVIASRMHAGIMALSNTIPVYQISYAIKITEFYRRANLLTTYLYDSDKVTKENLTKFLVDGLSNKLTDYTQSQYTRLNQVEAVAYSDLVEMKALV